MTRKAELARKTNETDVKISLDLDGRGACRVETGIPFFDHMLLLMCRHGGIQADIWAQGDLQVDFHHTVEDVGITLGRVLAQALGEKRGIARYGQALVPMDEALVEAALDISGRPYLVMNVAAPGERVGAFDKELVPQFFQALVSHAGFTLHLNLRYGDNLHHVIEAVFKAFGRALGAACALTGETDIPSTKGVL